MAQPHGEQPLAAGPGARAAHARPAVELSALDEPERPERRAPPERQARPEQRELTEQRGAQRPPELAEREAQQGRRAQRERQAREAQPARQARREPEEPAPARLAPRERLA